MLQFYYDFLNKFVDRSDMNVRYMDTDSCYMAITSEHFKDVIKPEMLKTYHRERGKWFPIENNHYIFKEQSLYESRTPGLFKIEFSGAGIVCLAPKLYYCLGEEKKQTFM